MRNWMKLLRPSIAATAAGLALAACAPDDASPSAGAGATATTTAAAPRDSGAGETPTTMAAPPIAVPAAAGAAGTTTPRRVVLYGVDLTGVGYDRGSPDAPIVMVDFSDFGCPFCGRHARETQPALDKEFVAAGKMMYKYVPFVMGMFPNGDIAARAAECGGEQGKFWEMHDALYADQFAWKQRRSAPFNVFQAHAAAIGLDGPRFRACFAENRGGARTRRSTAAAQALGIRATPTFFIDGQAIEGALPLAEFRRLLQERVR